MISAEKDKMQRAFTLVNSKAVLGCNLSVSGQFHISEQNFNVNFKKGMLFWLLCNFKPHCR